MRVVLGVTGSIAAYKSAELIRRLRCEGHEIRVVMTKHAAHFITPLTLQTLSQNAVTVEQFELVEDWEIGHIETARWADLLLVAPATANIIAKFASGVADDALSTLFLSTQASVIIAPAMNPVMWADLRIQEAVERLSRAGVVFVGPDAGETACGETGWGRLTDLEKIIKAIQSMALPRKDMTGLSVLISAGPTREFIDPIRYLTNRSSGKQGYALAEAAKARGAEVTLVSGPVELSAPVGVEMIKVVSAAEMHEAMMERLPNADVILMCAAVADFTPSEKSSRKIKKESADGLSLHLMRTTDVLKEIGAQKKANQILVGFAAESENLEESAANKMKSKNCDLMAANLIEDGFGNITNRVLLLDSKNQIETYEGDKRLIAEAILSKAIELHHNK